MAFYLNVNAHYVDQLALLADNNDNHGNVGLLAPVGSYKT